MPNNIGFIAIFRENFIARHISPYIFKYQSLVQFNTQSAIVYIYCTYNKIDKIKVITLEYYANLTDHKKVHLVKPEIMVAPDGYVLEVLGPYFSDARNEIRNWFQNGDIVIVDRDYRDCIAVFKNLGIQFYMPSFLSPHQNQFSTL